MSDARVSTGMRAQLRLREQVLAQGADPIGWKIGLNPPAVLKSIGLDRPVVGFLTSATLLGDGDSYSIRHAENPAVEPEVAIELGRGVAPDAPRADAAAAIAGLAPALEVVDLDTPLDELATVIGHNVFHRGVVLGEAGGPEPPTAGRLFVDGELRAEPDLPDLETLADTVLTVAGRLAEAGEALRAGERIIAGALVQAIPAVAGETVRLELDPHGAVELALHP